ncbi:MAG TPA: hypothetical protein VFC47_11330 [Caulobacteraceae bacterium]|nr:hypothetical protein [Caulobacteraceae bacterium]
MATVGIGLYQAHEQSQAAGNALAEQTQASNAQERSSRAAEEDAQLQASGQDASARIARAAGQRVLAFQGDSAGVLTDSNKTPGAGTLGG